MESCYSSCHLLQCAPYLGRNFEVESLVQCAIHVLQAKKTDHWISESMPTTHPFCAYLHQISLLIIPQLLVFAKGGQPPSMTKTTLLTSFESQSSDFPSVVCKQSWKTLLKNTKQQEKIIQSPKILSWTSYPATSLSLQAEKINFAAHTSVISDDTLVPRICHVHVSFQCQASSSNIISPIAVWKSIITTECENKIQESGLAFLCVRRKTLNEVQFRTRTACSLPVSSKIASII